MRLLISSRFSPFRKTFLLIAAVTAFAAISAVDCSANAASPALSKLPAIQTPAVAPDAKGATEAEPIQLADEIIRRLRRLGINFSKTRITRPYDPDWYVC